MTKTRLVGLNPGVNFINFLPPAFTLADPKSVKKIDNLTVFFTLLGSASVKVVRRTLMKLSPGGGMSIKHLSGYSEIESLDKRGWNSRYIFF